MPKITRTPRLRQAFWWILIILLAIIPFWLAYQIRHHHAYDDAYITLTYARNIAQGRGFIYNGGEPYLGTTSPLLALLLGALGAIFPTFGVYQIALWLGAAMWGGAIVVASLIGRRIASPLAGLFMALAVASTPVFPHVLHAEYPLLIFLSLSALFLTIKRRYWRAGVLFGLAFLAR